MSKQFDFDKVMAALQNGRDPTGKDSILTPLILVLANELLRKSSAFSPWRNSTTEQNDSVVYRRAPGPEWGRTDRQCAAGGVETSI